MHAISGRGGPLLSGMHFQAEVRHYYQVHFLRPRWATIIRAEMLSAGGSCCVLLCREGVSLVHASMHAALEATYAFDAPLLATVSVPLPGLLLAVFSGRCL